MDRAVRRAAARSLALSGLWIASIVVLLALVAGRPWQWLLTVLVVGVATYGWRWLDRYPRTPVRPLIVVSLIAFAGSVLVAFSGLRGLVLAGATAGIVVLTFLAGAWWLIRGPSRGSNS